MKQHNAAYQVVPYPKMRRWLASVYCSVQHKPMIHGLIEVDVTRGASTGNRNVLDWQHLQLLLFPSGTQQAFIGRGTMATTTNSCDGEWSDGPSLVSP